MGAAKKPKEEYDEDIGVKPVNHQVDFVLGALFLALVGRMAYAFSGDLQTGQLFLACLVGTVVASKLTAVFAGFVGQAFSRYRTHSSIPVNCRDPLSSPLQKRKFGDQAWQLAIHTSMACYEIHLIQGTTWFESPATCFTPCPSEYINKSQVILPSVRFFYILQLAIWTWTGFSCKWIESRRKDYVVRSGGTEINL
jgi:ceramide synthetase